ncbi:MAG: hypothetical protein JNK75_01190 [Betaproteobacteria bacterium]|nr:hypothetical protein [Betaproteobacteria bacterium]
MTTDIVSLGCEAGGPEAAAVCKLKVALGKALAKHVTSPHCAAIDRYALVLRVDGSLASYGAEGIARLRLQAAQRYITADIQVPQATWQPLAQAELKAYLAQQVQSALSACISRLRKGKHRVAEERLRAEVGAACVEYLAAGDG